MSSSDSSEEDEVAKRISQAVIPESFLFQQSQSPSLPALASVSSMTSTSVSASSQSLQSNSNVKQGKQDRDFNIPLKSNRPDKCVDKQGDLNRPGYVKTTPEFRAFIAKQLSCALDREIDVTLKEKAWNKKCAVLNEKKEKLGIKLFSNAKQLCFGDKSDTQVADSTPRERPKIQAKRHRLGSSSESSEEDKINSCVFSVDDILYENRMLEDLSKSGLAQSQANKAEKATEQKIESCNQDVKQSSQTEKKKKKKMKKMSSSKADTDSGCDEKMMNGRSVQVGDSVVPKKKKRKEKQKNKEDFS